MRGTRPFVVIVALLALSILVAACGDSDSGSDSGSEATANSQFPPPTSAPDDATKGGDLKVLAVGDVDYIDPGAAYYQFSYLLTGATQRQLLSWAPADTTQPTPDIATDQPTISDDGKTVTYDLQSGIEYSPPVNREVVCDDFKYAIERSLLPGVSNGYVGLYFTDIVGFGDAQKAAEQEPTKAPDIAGVTCPDDQTLKIELTDTSELGLIGALGLPIGSPVPREYAAPFDAENPSTYGDHQVATGPYMIENDADGELTGYTSGKEIKLVRNPNWDASTDFRPAYLDTVDIQEGFTDTDSASKKILAGDGYVNGDFGLDATSLKLAATQYPDQLSLTPSGGNRYVTLNTTSPPFDDINVRKAVIAASNRTDLRNTRGGELVGPVASHIIPPGLPGFEEAGGLDAPDLDYLQNPNGDMALATEYMKKAGFDSGKCEGSDCEVTMVGDDAPPGSDTAEVFKDQLEQLGFQVDSQKVDHSTMITRFCGVPKNEPDVCANFGWLKDFQDPQSMLQNTFSGDAIVPSNNSNWPLLDDPAVNKAIHDAVYVDDPAERAQAWGDVDDMVMEQAVAVPWVWDNQSNIRSADVNGVMNLFNATWDLSFTSIAQ